MVSWPHCAIKRIECQLIDTALCCISRISSCEASTKEKVASKTQRQRRLTKREKEMQREQNHLRLQPTSRGKKKFDDGIIECRSYKSKG